MYQWISIQVNGFPIVFSNNFNLVFENVSKLFNAQS